MTKPVNEDSVAANTLKPQNKSQMLGAALAKLAGLDIEDLSHYLNDTLAQIGHEADGVPDASGKNAASLNMKPSAAASAMKESVKADLNTILGEGEELSEEVREQTTNLFEAALEARLIVEREELIEEMNTRLEEAYEQITEDMANKVDAYLDVVVEQWLTDNEVAIESSLRNEVMDDFITGMRNLFAEHYMNVPEDKVEVVEELANKVEELETSLDTAITENATLKGELLESQKNDVIDAVCEGLALTTAEKLRSLSENVEFDGDLETFKTKVTMVKENLSAKAAPAAAATGILTEESDPDAAQGTEKAPVRADVRRYSEAISRSVRKF